MQKKIAGGGRRKKAETVGPVSPAGSVQPDSEGMPAELELGKGTRERTRQAQSDISRGLKDTDLHGVPSDVPGPAPEPQRSPGAKPIGGRGIAGAKRRP